MRNGVRGWPFSLFLRKRKGFFRKEEERKRKKSIHGNSSGRRREKMQTRKLNTAHVHFSQINGSKASYHAESIDAIERERGREGGHPLLIPLVVCGSRHSSSLANPPGYPRRSMNRYSGKVSFGYGMVCPNSPGFG